MLRARLHGVVASVFALGAGIVLSCAAAKPTAEARRAMLARKSHDACSTLIIQRTEPAKQRETCRSGIRADGAFSLGLTVHLEARSNRVVTKALVYGAGGSSYAAQKVFHRLAGEAYEYDPLGETSRRMRYFIDGPREVEFIDGRLRVLPRWDDDPQIPKELQEVVQEELTKLVVPIVGWPSDATGQPQTASAKAIEDRLVTMAKLGLRETTVVLSADIVGRRSRRERSGEATVFDVTVHPWVASIDPHRSGFINATGELVLLNADGSFLALRLRGSECDRGPLCVNETTEAAAETEEGDCREGTFDLDISLGECEVNIPVSKDARQD